MPIGRADLDDYQALRNVWRQDPALYARQRLGINLTNQQSLLFDAIGVSGAKVSVRAGHGVGKTLALAAVTWWHLECFDFCRIPCTAPTASQLYNVLWAELAKTQRRADEQAEKLGLPEELRLSALFNRSQNRVADVGAPNEWFAIARTSRKDAPDALQGFHASDLEVLEDGSVKQRSEGGGALLFVIEEASGVPDTIFEVAEGALSSHGARLIMVGNPTRNSGFFARSHKQDRALYTTLHFRCSDSPLVSGDYRTNLIRKYGEGSNVVRVRADGEFPNQDDDVLISLELTEAALAQEPTTDRATRILGVDVARFGDDRTVYVLREGNRVEHIEIRAKQDTMATAGQAMLFWRQWKADAIHVDVVGVGSGVADRLREQQAPVVDVNVSEKAPDHDDRAEMRRSGSYRSDAQPYKMRDYLWLEMHRWLRDDAPSIIDDDNGQDLAGELCSVRYGLDSSGRLVIESKDAMKKRGLRSPDIADSLATTFYPERARMVISDNFLARVRGLRAQPRRF